MSGKGDFDVERFRTIMKSWTGGKSPDFVARMELGEIDDIQYGQARQDWAMPDWSRNPDGSLFGGYTAALLDQITAMAAFSVLGEGEFIKTTQLQVDYHRPVMGPTAEIIGEVVNESRNAIHLEAKIVNPDGKTAARGRAIYARKKIGG